MYTGTEYKQRRICLIVKSNNIHIQTSCFNAGDAALMLLCFDWCLFSYQTCMIKKTEHNLKTIAAVLPVFFSSIQKFMKFIQFATIV